jgi:crotonobetainyl-CoA:carnitine CoA-transferase CaiB-like acyl-CoA transferase
MPAAPLAHLHVLDLTDLRGALAGRLLADLGADVIKIEPPAGDPGRARPPFVADVPGPDRSLAFLYRNANKRGTVIDLHDADGWRRFCAFAEHADVLIENFGAAEQRRHGLAPVEVRARHPHLIHLAPRGRCTRRGSPTSRRAGCPAISTHDCASVYGVAGVLAAVLGRARDGAGQTVEVSVQEAAISGLNPWQIPPMDWARMYPMLPTIQQRNADGAYSVLGTEDGFVRLLPATPRQWAGFVELLGQPEALTGPEWTIPLFRLANADVIRLIGAEALSDRRREDVLARGRGLGVPISPVNSPDAFVAEEQTRARAYFRATGFPGVGEAPFAPAPLNFSATPAVLCRPAPSAGGDPSLALSPRPAEGSCAGSGRT